MTTKERILLIRLADHIERQKEYAKTIGICVNEHTQGKETKEKK